jgi:hypothetical protein
MTRIFQTLATAALSGTAIDPAGPGGADIHLEQEVTRIDALAELLTPDGAADFLMIWDDADGVHKKIQPGNLPAGMGAVQLGSFNANSATFPASAPAAATSRNEHPLLAYDDTTAEKIVFHGVMSRDYGGGNLTIDIDWVAATAVIGGVAWGIEVERIAPTGQDIDADGFAAQQIGISTTSGTSGVVIRTSIVLTQAEADSIAAGDVFRLRIERVVADGGDDLNGDAQLLRVGLRQ